MADLISGIKGVPPSYPIKPVQPGPQDRKSGQRKKEQPRKDRQVENPQGGREDAEDHPGDRPADDDRPPTIDEYV